MSIMHASDKLNLSPRALHRDLLRDPLHPKALPTGSQMDGPQGSSLSLREKLARERRIGERLRRGSRSGNWS